ncbi:hypothetical protein HDZ31DRAFT_38205 [Schizophyllum fasciatum]
MTDRKRALGSATFLSLIHHVEPAMPPVAPYFDFDALPVELQILVLEFYLPERPNITMSPKEDNLMDLSLVCRKWLGIVSTTGTLWAKMSIAIGEKETYVARSQAICRRLEHWLALSKSCPLSIRFSYSCDHSKLPTSSVCIRAERLGLQVVAMLGRHASRWQHMEYQCPSTLLRSFSSVEGGEPSSFPRLCGFSLDVTGTRATSSAVDARDLPLPLSRLTQLNLITDYNRLLSLKECLDLLSQCPRLQHSSFNLICDDEIVAAHPRPHCELRSLQIQLRSSGTSEGEKPLSLKRVAQFLEMLRVGELAQLYLECMGDTVPCGAPRLAQAIARCANLLSLKLHDLPMAGDEIIACLQGMNRLTTLSLSYPMWRMGEGHSPVTQDFLRAIGQRVQGGQLKTVRLVSPCPDLGEEDVMRFVSAYIAGNGEGDARPRSFRLGWEKTPSSQLRRWVDDSRAHYGDLDLVITRFRYGWDS